MKQTPAGKRIHWITLENPGPAVPDGDGGFTQVYVPLTPSGAWASIDTASARDQERLAAGTVISSKSSLVKFPYHSGVTTKTRITCGSSVMSVVGVDNPERRNIETECLAVEVVA